MARWIDIQEARRAIQEGTGTGVKVAILDSGVDTSHAKLRGMKLVDDLAVVPDEHRLRVVEGGGEDTFGHGTAVE
jgi:subtilisin family serine protease